MVKKIAKGLIKAHHEDKENFMPLKENDENVKPKQRPFITLQALNSISITDTNRAPFKNLEF